MEMIYRYCCVTALELSCPYWFYSVLNLVHCLLYFNPHALYLRIGTQFGQFTFFGGFLKLQHKVFCLLIPLTSYFMRFCVVCLGEFLTASSEIVQKPASKRSTSSFTWCSVFAPFRVVMSTTTGRSDDCNDSGAEISSHFSHHFCNSLDPPVISFVDKWKIVLPPAAAPSHNINTG